MIKRVGILTFHASHNYGSMLQAYALQTCLERLGHHVTIVNYRGLAQKSYYIKPGKQLTKRAIRSFFESPSLFVQNVGKWNKFERFIREHDHVSREHRRLVETEHLINEELGLSAIITGGDQIWNMDCLDFNPCYYLPFETPGIRRIAYSPSLGDEDKWKSRNYSNVLKTLVGGYDYPSVREKSASLFLSGLIGRSVPSVPDPTLLLDRDDYERLAGEKPLIKGQYVFYYTPWQIDAVSEFVSGFAKIHGYRVVTSKKNHTKAEKGFIAYNNAGPVEFLNLLKNATVVCGFSLHLVLLSLIFHKDFYAVTQSGGARIGDILDEFGLSSHLVYAHSDPSMISMGSIDWKEVDSKLAVLKQSGIGFLRNALM